MFKVQGSPWSGRLRRCCAAATWEGGLSIQKRTTKSEKKKKMNQGDEQKLDKIKLQSSRSPTGLRKLKLRHREPLQIAIVGGGVNAWANRFADRSLLRRQLLPFQDWNPDFKLRNLVGTVTMWVIP